LTGNLDISGNVGIGGDSGTETLLVAGSERVTGTSSLSGNVGIGGDSGTETLLVAGSERVTSNLHVGPLISAK